MREASCLEHRHIARCSDDLKAATAAVEAWGRQRWPGARVIHELRVGGCRIDIAFVQPDHIAGVEIKSAKDTLARLPEQIRQYTRELPEVWIAVAPKFAMPAHEDGLPWGVGRLVLEPDGIAEGFPCGASRHPHPAKADEMITAPMLHLLWRQEAAGLAAHHGITVPPRLPLYKLVKILARRLTGDQIVSGVCRALRARPIRWTADPPIADQPTPTTQDKGREDRALRDGRFDASGAADPFSRGARICAGREDRPPAVPDGRAIPGLRAPALCPRLSPAG